MDPNDNWHERAIRRRLTRREINLADSIDENCERAKFFKKKKMGCGTNANGRLFLSRNLQSKCDLIT